MLAAGGLLTVPASVVVGTAAAATSDPVIAAAGDIACDPADSNFSGASSSACQMAATAKLIAGMGPRYVLPIGDTQYHDGGLEPTINDFMNGYDKSWGPLRNAVSVVGVRPVPGNHEYGDDDNGQPPTQASSYFDYFGPSHQNDLPSNVTAPSNDWYSYDVAVNGGTWHVIAIDSECGAVPAGSAANGCASGSPEETWLRNDLAAHQNQCTVAYWHEPRWSEGGVGNAPEYAAFWNDVVQYHVAMVLNGHEHFYQHFGPMDANGNLVNGGTSQFIVGTGGVNLGSASTTPRSAVLAQDDVDFGALKLTLHATAADYSFITTGNVTRDSGSVACNAIPPSGAPTVTSVSPASGASSGGTTVTVNGSGFGSGTTVTFGSVAASGVVVASSTSLTATAPAGTSTTDVRVTNSSGTSPVSPADEFTYTYANNGYGVSLSANTTSPSTGSSVTLTATSNQDVGPTPYGMSIVDVSTGAMVLHVGSGKTASAAVNSTVASTHRYVGQIDTKGGAPIQAVSSPVVMRWTTPPPPSANAPTVAAVSPIFGPSTGGTKVTVTGTNFGSGTTVSFGSAAASSVAVSSPTSLTSTAPAGTTTVDVRVTNPSGTSAASAADQFTYTFANNGYSISLAASSTAPTVGKAVTLTATANQDVGPTPYGMSIMDVSTGAEVAHVGSGKSMSVSVSQPAASKHRYIGCVCNGGGTNAQAVSTPVVVTWSNPPPPPAGSPTVTAVSPISGPSAGGTKVTVTGTNFGTGTTVAFGTVAATGVVIVSSTSLTATAPAGTTTVDVRVTNGTGTSAVTAADEYTYTFANNGYAVSLTSTATAAAVGGAVTLKATANQDVGPTPYGMSIMDVTTGTEVGHVGSGSSMSVTVSQSTASTHRYVGCVCNSGGINQQAVSTPIVVRWS
jgi:hypothetical protein